MSDEPECGCLACLRVRNRPTLWVIVCSVCGNKRCPHANNHAFACTGSNAVGQAGSVYELPASAGPYTHPPTPPDPLAALTRRVEALEAAAGISRGWNGG